MLTPSLFEHLGETPRCLFLGAHCDDIEIGCGGTVLELLAAKPDAHIKWIVLSSDPVRESETLQAAGELLGKDASTQVSFQQFRNSFFPQQTTEIKEYFESLKADPAPDLIFTHFRGDLHQDHRVVGELTWNTFRNHLIFEYEIPKYDGGLGSPGVFIPVSRKNLERKISVLMSAFPSQADKQWFTEETFRALPRLRGIECNAPDGFAEAFYCAKTVFRP